MIRVILSPAGASVVGLRLASLIWLDIGRLFPGSSVVEQPAVNRLVGGSNPSRGAIFEKELGEKFIKLFFMAYRHAATPAGGSSVFPR
jgi:hypothetical protein